MRLAMLNFFFQAEDGIRDSSVTGVQTCALPILEPGGGGGGCPAPLLPRGEGGEHHAPPRLAARRRVRKGTKEDRKSVGEGKRGDLGGRRIIKKKKEDGQ